MGFGSFLIHHPFETVRYNIILIATRTFFPVIDIISFPVSTIVVRMLPTAGCWNNSVFQHTVANGAFLMLCTIHGICCCSVGNPVAGGMSRFLRLCAAGAFMPVLISIGLPLAAIAVGMLTAGCRNSSGFQYTVANGAFLMLCTVSGSRS